MKKYYITTPLYYVNGDPHIGHAYTCIMADVLARYHRMKGEEVFFLTGTDEHGQKIEEEAKKRNIAPSALADQMVERFTGLWQDLSISYDDFIRTSQERHKKIVLDFFNILLKSGDIYLGKYSGWYCVPCETFWTETQLNEGKCPDCGRDVSRLEEEGYFFRMSKYTDKLLKYYEQNPDFVRPATRQNEVVSFVKEGLRDLCITRKSLSWGVKVQSDPEYSIYVWFDALLNYISAAGFLSDNDRFCKLWPADIHLLAKDILKFHAVIWPAMLMAANLPLPKTILVHGWWLKDSRKMSKSLDNAVDPSDLIEKYSADALRYFLLREVSLGLDGNFSVQAFEKRFNSDLANDIGNLLNRSLTMIEKYFDSKIPSGGLREAPDLALTEKAKAVVREVPLLIEALNFNTALEKIWEFINIANKYIEDSAPWKLKKENSGRLDTVLFNMAESLRIIAVLVYPFMPSKSLEMLSQLGIEKKAEDIKISDIEWGSIKTGSGIKKGSPLFPRLERKE
jgi:methionyl-tRNA synthetase